MPARSPAAPAKDPPIRKVKAITLFDIDAHESRGVLVLGHGPHGLAEGGFFDQEGESHHEYRSYDDIDDDIIGNDRIAEVDIHPGENVGEGAIRGTHRGEGGEKIFQKHGNADSGYEG
jgi:hypothetical protein